MFKKHAFKLLTFFILALALFILSISSFSPSQAAATRIMPLGDSITGSPGCWRSILWNRLQSTGYTNIDFVGTLPPQGCALPHDGDNEGHGGILATNMADQNQLPGWLSATNPDIVLMHLGTNDVWSARSTTTILNAFSKLVDQMRANNPNMKIIVAKIIPMDPARSCADCDQRVIALNNALPSWASGKSTAQSPIVVVDQWTGFSTSSDTYDGVHPNASGDQKMSDKWYPALVSFLTGSPTSVPPTSIPATPTSYVCVESQITGAVYAVSAGAGNELAGASVGCSLNGSSSCATSCTPSNLTTGSNGAFSFTVDHYMDTFILAASAPGYQSASCSVSCNIYTGCTPCQIVLAPVSTAIVYQAENATLGGGAAVNSNNPGFFGTGFANFPANGGYVEFRNVDGGTGGSRTLRLRNTLASGSRTGRLTVNGVNQNITFTSTGSWTTWTIHEVTVNLNAGTSNTIRLQSTGQDLANLDQMEVAGGTPVTSVPPTSVPPTTPPATTPPATTPPPTTPPPTTPPPTTPPPTTPPPTTGPGCNPVTSTITVPFTFDGAGTFCWQTNNLGAYINSWNLAGLTVNGVDFTNRWAGSGSYPPAINGSWYISYRGNFPWSHFETK